MFHLDNRSVRVRYLFMELKKKFKPAINETMRLHIFTTSKFDDQAKQGIHSTVSVIRENLK